VAEQGKTEGRRATRDKLKSGGRDARSKIASAVWLAAVVCALFLAVGALLVALKMNPDNAIVAFILDGADLLDLGEFKQFDGKNEAVKAALTNWGIAAVIYLVVGKVLEGIIRP
jgi:hypothetical protein